MPVLFDNGHMLCEWLISQFYHCNLTSCNRYQLQQLIGDDKIVRGCVLSCAVGCISASTFCRKMCTFFWHIFTLTLTCTPLRPWGPLSALPDSLRVFQWQN